MFPHFGHEHWYGVVGANNGAGLPFLWTPAHATVGLTGYMVFAQITDMPITSRAAFRLWVSLACLLRPFTLAAEYRPLAAPAMRRFVPLGGGMGGERWQAR